MRRLLALALLVLAGCGTTADQADAARKRGEHGLAAELYGRAAIDARCPDRARLLLLRSDMQLQDGAHIEATKTLDAATATCPDYAPAHWRRAQAADADGDRDRALEEARAAQSSIPQAAELVERITHEMAFERAAQERAAALVEELRDQLDIEAASERVSGSDAAELARTVPVPITLKWAVQHRVDAPERFEVTWSETQSFRGEAGDPGYWLVRRLDVPEIENTLPWDVRLTLSNLRQPMRFRVDDRGRVEEAVWHKDGPERGMRPDMLRPEIEGALKRRRLFDPGEAGTRAPGDRWSGEDVRVLDGRAVPLQFESVAEAWERVRGVRTLRVRTTLTGEGVRGQETRWLHPATAVPVEWRRELSYPAQADGGTRRWQERTEAVLVEVSGS